MALGVLVADYGLNVYYGGMFSLADRLARVREAGYSGLERLSGLTEAQIVEAAATFRRLGMQWATVLGPNVEATVRWAAAFGCAYVWADVPARDTDTYCRQVNEQARACAEYGVRVAVHNHLGSPVETQEQLERFLAACPEAGLILDTAHLAAAGGDAVDIANRFCDRVTLVHFKDWIAEREAEAWYERGRFCELGAGNIGLDNAAVGRALLARGYTGPFSVEQDTHVRDPLIDLRVSRDYLAACGI